MTKTLYAPGTSGIGVVARAEQLEGDPCTPGWCLYYQLTKVFKVPGLGDYDHDGDADCLDYWKAAKKRGTVVETTNVNDIPIGALVIWSVRNGHAATYLGNRKILSTDLPKKGRFGIVDIGQPEKVWGHKLLGYVLVDGNGFTLLRPGPAGGPLGVETREDLPEPAHYTVTAKSGVIGRRGPSTSAAKVRLAKFDHHVTAVAIVTANGREWAVTTNNVYYALEYLKAS